MIKINELNFSYSKKNKLYKNLSLDAKEGSIIGLLGKNGAGKSTLLKLMAGLLKPQSGEVEILGYTPFKRNPNFLRHVFFVGEEINVASVSIKCYTSALSPLYPNFNQNKFKHLLSEFELDIDANLSKMSYGQKKKFIIAFALASNCRTLLMDEPTNGLDIPSKAQFRKVLAGSLADDQVAIISTHQVKDVENLIDQVVIVDEGDVVFNKSLVSISEQFSFATSSENTDSLYSEVAPGGYKCILAKNHIETPIDIELLFNAVINKSNLQFHEPVLQH
ncbi:ABC transporter ATP-binding protein [Labilibacter marinus]|uniref:ABC transporter ATP-binding protein n=1 Tax=Labilibacter marinus TaxID=1477105 RepID=UPI00094F542C|nr:ABC transporter ATP-binding protein [Labilibacter marinus]